MTSFAHETIWLIGASSGIGHALAQRLSDAGATLVLSARSADTLHALNQELGGKHQVIPLDVSGAQAVADATARLQDAYARIDRVIFLAATYSPGSLLDFDISEAEQVVHVNLTSAYYLIHAVIPMLKAQQGGQLVLTASVAGYRGLPGGQPYCATKAALINLAESLALEVDRTIDVKIISPGFVKTRLTEKNDFPMPFMITPEKAADAIARGLRRRAFEIHFPKQFTYVMKLLELLPHWAYFGLMRAASPKR